MFLYLSLNDDTVIELNVYDFFFKDNFLYYVSSGDHKIHFVSISDVFYFSLNPHLHYFSERRSSDE